MYVAAVKKLVNLAVFFFIVRVLLCFRFTYFFSLPPCFVACIY